MESKFPKLYNTEDAAALLDLSAETLKNFRADLTGPNFVRMGNSIKYLEEDLLEYIRAQRQLPTDSTKMQAALLAGRPEARAAMAQRNADLTLLVLQTASCLQESPRSKRGVRWADRRRTV